MGLNNKINGCTKVYFDRCISRVEEQQRADFPADTARIRGLAQL